MPHASPLMFSRFPLSHRLSPVDQYKGSQASQLSKQHAKMPLGWELQGTYLGKMSREGTSALETCCGTKGCGSCGKWFLCKSGIPTKT